jgi:hypothetical protein
VVCPQPFPPARTPSHSGRPVPATSDDT